MKQLTLTAPNGYFKDFLKALNRSKVQYTVQVGTQETKIIIPLEKENMELSNFSKLMALCK